METLIVAIKNKREKQVLTAFLTSLDITFRTEDDEDKALIKLYKKAKQQKEKPVPFDANKLLQ